MGEGGGVQCQIIKSNGIEGSGVGCCTQHRGRCSATVSFCKLGFVMISVNTPSENYHPEGECFLLKKVKRLKRL